MTDKGGHRVLRFLSKLVPADSRDIWLREWQAELTYHSRPNRSGAKRQNRWFVSRLIAAFQHAMWLRLMGGSMNGLSEDVRSTLRVWKRTPVFSATVLLTLALGVGLFSAVLSFADGYLFRPLPFPGADRTYYVKDPNAAIASALSSADVAALLKSPVAEYGFVEWSTNDRLRQIEIDGRSVELFSYEVSPGFRKTLALPLAAGRDFSLEDHAQSSTVAGWLSYRCWLREFGGDFSVVGKTFPAAGPMGSSGALKLLVVGILGREVSTLDLNNRPPDVVLASQGPRLVGPNILAFPIAMLPERTTIDQAVTQIAAVLQSARPAKDGRPRTVKFTSFAEAQVAGGRPTAKLLFAGAMLVFLLAAMNLVHLLLGRGASRVAEVRTRVALGASRWRIVRAFVVENVMMAIVGTAGGLLIGGLLSELIAARVPALPTGARNLTMVPMIFDARVIGISAALGLVVAFAGGIWPARRAWRSSLQPRASTANVSRRLARILLASELTVVTVVAAGVVFASFGVYQYLNQPLGYEFTDRARVSIQIPGKRLAGADAVTVLNSVRAVPGVRNAGLDSAFLPQMELAVSGTAIDFRHVSRYGISSGLFEAWGMKLRAGRWFEPAEFGAGDAVVVDERFARLAWPDVDPVGQSVRSGDRMLTVVGVVASQRWRLDMEPSPTVFVPSPESSGRAPIVLWAPGVDATELSARVTSAVTAAIPAARVTVTKTTFDSLLARSVGEARFQIPVVIAFGLLAGALALVGVFGIVSFLVHQRTREFGVRIALGARPADIRSTVLQDSVRPALAGLALGTIGAWTLSSVVESTVFGWKTSGLETFAVVAGVILGVAIVAALAPASRAARTDPAITLRID